MGSIDRARRSWHVQVSDGCVDKVEWQFHSLLTMSGISSRMANLRFTLTVIAVGLILAALALGWFAPIIITWVPDKVDAPHLFLAAFVFVGLCGVAFYSMMERALNPVLSIVDAFTRMRAGDLHPRLPVEGPEEMRRMALGFNDMGEDLETQVRDIEVEK